LPFCNFVRNTIYEPKMEILEFDRLARDQRF
jgi:hypothetical protein